MKDQHEKISGYRDLTQEEIDLMNEAKQLEARCLAFHEKVGDHLLNQSSKADAVEYARQARSNSTRWHSIARTDLETGFMALVRSIAQPQPTKLKEE